MGNECLQDEASVQIFYHLQEAIDSKVVDLYPVFSSFFLHARLTDTICPAESHQGPHEERLINDLLNPYRYNPLARPVENESEALDVKFGLSLQQIVDLVRGPKQPGNRNKNKTRTHVVATGNELVPFVLSASNRNLILFSVVFFIC